MFPLQPREFRANLVPVAPPHLFSVRELSEELESGARRNGCDSDDQRPRSADSLNRECDSPDQSQTREHAEGKAHNARVSDESPRQKP